MLIAVNDIVQWHAEWHCNNAERAFSVTMSRDPLREDNMERARREVLSTQVREEERIQNLGGLEKAREIDAIDDVSGCTMETWYSHSLMPYPGCECLLWGSSQLKCNAWNQAMASFNGACQLACDWGDYGMAKIDEAEIKAIEEIRATARVVSPELENAYDPRDHFPEWQQFIMNSTVTDAVYEVKAMICKHNGTPGEKAGAAKKEAEDHFIKVMEAARSARGERILDNE